MSIYIYLSLYPESLIASMMPPAEFGHYLAVGTTKREIRQEAVYFELDRKLCESVFDLSDVEKRCIPHANGEPKHTVYYSIYRVLERVPMDAMKGLYLSTQHGKVLALAPSTTIPAFKDRSFFYQEIAPIHPRIVSSLDPIKFAKLITDEKNKMYVPKICFVDLRLGGLADDPEGGSTFDLPYPQLDNLRKCLMEIKEMKDKQTKTVNRHHPSNLLFRTINHGFFVGDQEKVLYYPFPPEKELNSTYYDWWRSALQ
jgi:hypothetical protein